MKIYTRKGDDGTTGLYYGGRVPKNDVVIEVNGALDEAQALIGLARSFAQAGGELDERCLELERQLYVLMAEVATSESNRHKLQPGSSLVTQAMVDDLEAQIDVMTGRFDLKDFVLPGVSPTSAALHVARTVVRRAERQLVGHELPQGSVVAAYLNRLSDLLWAMARWQEGEHYTRSKTTD